MAVHCGISGGLRSQSHKKSQLRAHPEPLQLLGSGYFLRTCDFVTCKCTRARAHGARGKIMEGFFLRSQSHNPREALETLAKPVTSAKVTPGHKAVTTKGMMK